VFVNGSPTEEFPLERGLRQDEFLSPFHFFVGCRGAKCHDEGYG